jgi:glycerol kinase
MQLQADLSGCPVEVAGDTEATALGAAMLAGLAVDVWSSTEEVAALIRRGARYEPTDRGDLVELRERWRHALRRATTP